MAGDIWIVGRVVDASRDSDQPPSIVNFTLSYMVTGVYLPWGQIVVLVDVQQNEAQVNAALRLALANFVNGMMPLGLTANDVMGCNI
jgi:hypothetical protein